MRIATLLQKISELAEHPESRTAIDVDLMLDYTRVLYADLLEWRSKLPVTRMPAGYHAEIAEPTPAALANIQAQEAPDSTPITVPDKPVPLPQTADQKSQAQAAVTALVKDIRSLIGINDKYQIMSVLFGNDKAAYEEALHHINTATGEQAALSWLRERLWVTEEHSDAAQSFYDIVARFYRS